MPSGIPKNGVNKGWFKKGHLRYSPKNIEKWKKNLSIANKGKQPFLGKHHSEKTKKKMSKLKKGKKRPLFSIKWRKNIGKAQIGKHHTEERKKEHKARMTGNKNPFYGRHHTEKSKERNRQKHSKEKNYNWKGGISFEPYSIDWTKTLRQSIRERDHYICQLCNKSQGDRVHSVHHIDYNKENCNPDNLITLCVGCNTKVNYNRDYWINYFQNLWIYK